MSLIVKDILASVYVLLGNITEEELPRIILLEQFASLEAKLKSEKVLSQKPSFLHKAQLEFPDTSGIIINTLTDFSPSGLVYLSFNGYEIEEGSINMLGEYRNAGRQAVAFYKDVDEEEEDDAYKVQQSIPSTGTMDIWYESFSPLATGVDDVLDLEDSFKFLMATRLAYNTIGYVTYTDPIKAANKMVLRADLREQSEAWKDDWFARLNNIGNGQPVQRIAFQAS